MAVINSILNARVNIKIVDDFLIQWIENWFSDDEVIFKMIMHLVTEQKSFSFFFL